MIMTHLIDKIAAVLQEGRRMTTRELAQEFGTHITHTREIVNKLHRSRRIHIAGWYRMCATGYPAPVFMWGDALDAPVPVVVQEKEVHIPETQSYATIAKLRETVVPGSFDPFRVLMAQVTA